MKDYDCAADVKKTARVFNSEGNTRRHTENIRLTYSAKSTFPPKASLTLAWLKPA